MARRSDHTREELHKMALTAARKIVAKEGLRGLSTRRIAGEIGYTAGTLYQLFDDLDDLILQVNGATLDDLYAVCKDVSLEGEPEQVLEDLADSYIRFVIKNPKLWAAVVEHNLPDSGESPSWYRDRISKLLGLVETALKPLYSSGSIRNRGHDAHVLWGSLYGIASLASADKLPSNVTAHQLVLSLIRNYVAGIRSLWASARQVQPRGSSRTRKTARSA